MNSSGEEEVEKIAGGIVEEAEKLALGKKAEAKLLASGILKKAEDERQARLQAEAELARAKAETEGNKELSLARVEAKKALLIERERLMDSAFDEANRRLERKSRAYSDWMKGIMEKFSKELPEGFTLVIDPKDAALVAGFKGKIVEREIGGGAIAEGADIVVDASWNSRLSEIREKGRAEIARRLFSREKTQ